MHNPLPHIGLRLVAIALIHTAILGWMVWDQVELLRHGKEIKLSVVPVDPRDLLRGDYVILRFGISRIYPKNVESDGTFKRGVVIFVGLKETAGGLWKAISLNHHLPQVKSDIVFIKGKVSYASGNFGKGTQLRIKYGIEKYFIPEGEGPGLEKLRTDKVLSIVAAVSTSGQAGIKALLVRGKSVYEEPLF